MLPRVAVLLVVGLAVTLSCAGQAKAGQPLDIEKMKVALKTSTPEEDGFLSRVSGLVEKDVLPRDLVDSTFLWARKQPGRPFQYFKRGLKSRAAKIGVRL